MIIKTDRVHQHSYSCCSFRVKISFS